MSISQLVYTNEDAEQNVSSRDGLDLLLARLAGSALLATRITARYAVFNA